MNSIERKEHLREPCAYCGSSSGLVFNGELVCRQCGTVLDKVYLDSSFRILPHSSRTATQFTNIGKRIDKVGELGSEIGYYRQTPRYSSSGQRIRDEVVRKYSYLNKTYHIPSKHASSQTHLRTFMIFNRIASKLQLPNSIKERTSYLYWKYANNQEYKISNHVLLIALCLLYAIRENPSKTPLRFQEIVQAFHEGGHRVTNRTILQLSHELNMRLNQAPIRKSEDYIDRITNLVASDVDIKKKLVRYNLKAHGPYEALLRKISYYLLSTLDHRARGGVQPFGFAVSIVYLADRSIARYLKKSPLLTQASISKITGAREYTVRDHCYKFLSKYVKEKMPVLTNIIRDHYTNA